MYSCVGFNCWAHVFAGVAVMCSLVLFSSSSHLAVGRVLNTTLVWLAVGQRSLCC
jgi:hypothetical protein